MDPVIIKVGENNLTRLTLPKDEHWEKDKVAEFCFSLTKALGVTKVGTSRYGTYTTLDATKPGSFSVDSKEKK